MLVTLLNGMAKWMDSWGARLVSLKYLGMTGYRYLYLRCWVAETGYVPARWLDGWMG